MPLHCRPSGWPGCLAARNELSCAIGWTTLQSEDGSEVVRYLVASGLTLSVVKMIGIYQRRWKTEKYIKSIKHCRNLGESPAHAPATQQAHCVAAIISYTKLEKA